MGESLVDNKYQDERIACAVIFGLIVAFSVFVLKQYFYASEKPLDLITAAIYFWTGVALAIYTYETYQLRKEAQRQTELQLRPFVIFEVIQVYSTLYRGRLKNIGNGTALNVKIVGDITIESVNIDSNLYGDIYNLSYVQGSIILEAHEEYEIHRNALQTSWVRTGYGNPDVLGLL